MQAHAIKTWPTTQHVIALSSREAELYALVKGAAQTQGLASMLDDFDVQFACTVCTDAAAASAWFTGAARERRDTLMSSTFGFNNMSLRSDCVWQKTARTPILPTCRRST